MYPNDQGISDTDLFVSSWDALPGIQASETLYSWCARFHLLSGSSRARSTSQLLFGHPSIGLHHDFPGRLDHYGAVTKHFLGTADEVSRRRTQYGLFAPFLGESVGQSLLEAMRTGSGTSVRKRLGVFRSGLGASTPLKACRQCIEEDRVTTPAAWWRMEHQWLPVMVCLRHRVPLVAAVADFYAPFPKDWHLPGGLSHDAWTTARLTNEQYDRLANVAQWTEFVTAASTLRFDAELLRYTYHLRAKARGWVAFDGSLRFHLLRDEFRKTYREVEILDGVAFLRSTTGVNGGFLSHLLRECPGIRHPQKQIFLMAFLFDDPSHLLQMYESAKDAAATDGLDSLRKLLTDTRMHLKELVATEGRSVNSACLELDVPPSLAIRHLKLEGVEYSRRPRVLTPELQDRLNVLLMSGESRNQIASALGIRKSFIKDYLAERPELRLAWKQADVAKRRAHYRAHFLLLLEEHSGVPIKRIRRISGSGFEWLYRNDLEWLKIHLPGIWHRPSAIGDGM